MCRTFPSHRPNIRVAVLLAACSMALALGLPLALAQPVRVPEHASYQWQIAGADSVVLGSLAGIKKQDDAGEYYVMSMSVRQTLLGEHRKHITFVVADATREMVEPWRERMDELLVVLVDARKLDRGDQPPQARDLQPQHLPHGRWCVFSMNPDAELQPVAAADLTVLRTPAEILRATRVAIAVGKAPDGKRPVLHKIIFSSFLFDEQERLRDAGMTGYFYYWVPVDSRLEANARTWIASDHFGLREEGAKALAYFKSEENIALMKPLLADPANWVSPEYPAEGGYRTYDYYPVRNAAWTALQAWGVKVEKPVIKVPRPKE